LVTGLREEKIYVDGQISKAKDNKGAKPVWVNLRGFQILGEVLSSRPLSIGDYMQSWRALQ
jgi:hypothetical protein